MNICLFQCFCKCIYTKNLITKRSYYNTNKYFQQLCLTLKAIGHSRKYPSSWMQVGEEGEAFLIAQVSLIPPFKQFLFETPLPHPWHFPYSSWRWLIGSSTRWRGWRCRTRPGPIRSNLPQSRSKGKRLSPRQLEEDREEQIVRGVGAFLKVGLEANKAYVGE